MSNRLLYHNISTELSGNKLHLQTKLDQSELPYDNTLCPYFFFIPNSTQLRSYKCIHILISLCLISWMKLQRNKKVVVSAPWLQNCKTKKKKKKQSIAVNVVVKVITTLNQEMADNSGFNLSSICRRFIIRLCSINREKKERGVCQSRCVFTQWQVYKSNQTDFSILQLFVLLLRE